MNIPELEVQIELNKKLKKKLLGKVYRLNKQKDYIETEIIGISLHIEKLKEELEKAILSKTI